MLPNIGRQGYDIFLLVFVLYIMGMVLTYIVDFDMAEGGGGWVTWQSRNLGVPGGSLLPSYCAFPFFSYADKKR